MQVEVRNGTKFEGILRTFSPKVGGVCVSSFLFLLTLIISVLASDKWTLLNARIKKSSCLSSNTLKVPHYPKALNFALGLCGTTVFTRT